MWLLTHSLGVTRQKRRKAQEPTKRVAKGKRKRQPVLDQDSMEVDELSQSSMIKGLDLSEQEQSHIHQITLNTVKVTC